MAGLGALCLSFDVLAQSGKPPTEQALIAKGARRLTVQEVLTARIGNTWYYLRIKDGAVFVVYFPDSKTSIAIVGGRKLTRLWWVEGDKTCGQSFFNDHSPTCSRGYVLDGQQYYCGEGVGVCEAIVRPVPGNPEGY